MKNKAFFSNLITSYLFFSLLALSLISALFYGKMQEVNQAMITGCKSAVELAFGLMGMMCLWLGLISILEKAGILALLNAKLAKPIKILFPNIPSDSPAISAIIMNFSANILGLGNAATPMGIQAMQELQKINPNKEEASDEMCMFLIINTSGLAVLPLGAVAIRASLGEDFPSQIILPTILSTTCNTLFAVFATLFIQKRLKSTFAVDKDTSLFQKSKNLNLFFIEKIKSIKFLNFLNSKNILIKATFLTAIFFFFYNLNIKGINFLKEDFLNYWLLPFLMFSICSIGIKNNINIYETITKNAYQGVEVSLKIIPFLIIIFVFFGMFRASNAFLVLTTILSPFFELFGLPTEVLPLAIIRPLSGSAATGLMSEIVANNPNTFTSFLASTIIGSTETTFYVIAVYFGAIGISNIKYTLLIGLLSDLVGVISSYIWCCIFW